MKRITIRIEGIDQDDLRDYANRRGLSVHAAIARLIKVGFHRVEVLRAYNDSPKGRAARKRYEERALAVERATTHRRDLRRKGRRA